jgi:Uma2 family endonuclease
MSVVTKRFTLEECLNYDDGTDYQYELVAGELVKMPPKIPQNSMITRYLFTGVLKFVPLTD